MARRILLVVVLAVLVCGTGIAVAQTTPTSPGSPISGTVVTDNLVPVANACVYALQAEPGDTGPLVGTAITAADGTYTISTIPAGLDIVVGFSPPFVGPDGPCSTSNGPPPVPAAGTPQGVWYHNVFLNFADPGLGSDPYGVAIAAGATTVRAGAAGINACLTSAPANVVPRTNCSPAGLPPPAPPVAVVIQPAFTG